MSRNYPDRVRPEKVAAAKKRFSGEIPLDSLDRLEGLIVAPKPGDVVRFDVSFAHDAHGHVVADLSVEANVSLVCQRTLGPFAYPINGQSRIGVVRTEAEAEGLPADYEPLICEEDDLSIARLVEEEMLLALPLVPIDPQAPQPTELAVEEELVKEPTHRPFEVLAELKKNRSGE